MVFFNCSSCGEGVKKNQVEKHLSFRCRNHPVLSCIDCSKEFKGDEYKSHNKCISEEQKYGGKNFVPKDAANKGERKQNEWTEQLQSAVQTLQQGSDPQVKELLNQLEQFPNVPRKKPKFMNFVKNSFGHRYRPMIVEKVWDAILSVMKQEKSANSSNSNNCATVQNGENRKRHSSEGCVDADEVKKKKTEDEANGEAASGEEEEEEETPANQKCKPAEKFDWHAVIKEIVTKKEEISLKKLKKKMMAAFLELQGGIRDEARFHSKLNKKLANRRYVLLNDRVRLRTES